jgi:hypothetical protein
MIASKPDPQSATGRTYVPIQVTDDHPETVYGTRIMLLMRSGEVLTPETWEAEGYRVESCTARELPELEKLAFLDLSGLSVALLSDGLRYIRSEALDLFSSEVDR